MDNITYNVFLAFEKYEPKPEDVCNFCKGICGKENMVGGPDGLSICLPCIELCNEIAQERKAAEREKQISEITSLLDGLPDSWQNYEAASSLYDAGWRKVDKPC